jgi:hypothetical protein
MLSAQPEPPFMVFLFCFCFDQYTCTDTTGGDPQSMSSSIDKKAEQHFMRCALAMHRKMYIGAMQTALTTESA